MKTWLFYISFLPMFLPAVSHDHSPKATLHKVSPREGCVSFTRDTQLCPFNGKTGSDHKANYGHRVLAINVALQTLVFDGANQSCIRNATKASCSQALPMCLENGTLDYGQEIVEDCRNIRRHCSSEVASFLFLNSLCHNTTLRVGHHSPSTCAMAKEGEVRGLCSRPKYKMPSEILNTYEVISIGLQQLHSDFNRSGVFNESCLMKMKNLICSPLYCSDDEKYLVVEHTREDCEDMLNTCFSTPASRDQRFAHFRTTMNQTCQSYPSFQASTASTMTPSFQPSTASTITTSFLLLVLAVSTLRCYLV